MSHSARDSVRSETLEIIVLLVMASYGEFCFLGIFCYNYNIMELKEKLNNDFKEAFKSKDADRLSVLKMVQSEIRNAEIAKRTKLAKDGESDLDVKSRLNDEEIISVISKEVKKRNDAAEMYEKGGRQDLMEKEKKEAEILSVYLPEKMNENELRIIIEETIKEIDATGAQDLGKLMSAVMLKIKGKTDGGSVSKIAKEILSR